MAKGKRKNRKHFTWKTVRRLCNIDATALEIAAVLDVHPNTLNNRCKKENGVTFEEYLKQHRLIGNVSLRRVMHRNAIFHNNTTMQKHLSNNRLGFKNGIPGDDETNPLFISHGVNDKDREILNHFIANYADRVKTEERPNE